MRFLYTLLAYCLLPLAFVRLTLRGRRNPAYRRRWAERLGYFAAMPAGGIWVHAVSVGEALSAVPLVKALRKRYPHRPIMVTTTTPTGSERVRAALGDSVRHVYAPYDVPGAVTRFLNRTRPAIALVMETELWPNLYGAVKARGVPLLLLNARLSTRSARGYRRLGALTRETLSRIDAIAAQSPDDAARYRNLGAPPERVLVTGNLKFDLSLPEDLRARGEALRAEWGGRPVWIAASTHEGEETQVLAAHRRLRERFPDLLLILVPRHPERFDRAAALCAEAGLPVTRRSRGERVEAGTAVYLGDTMGELMLLYAAADIAFVGGSLVPTGGHNLLEPAALGLPVLSGPQVFNFRQITDLLTAAGGVELVAGSEALAAAVARLLEDPAARGERGERARGVVEANRGALARAMDLIETRLR